MTVKDWVPLLAEWSASPAYFAITLTVPVWLGVNFTWHVAEAPLPERVHVAEENVPGLLLEKATFPVGVTAVPGLVSVTVTVHVVG